MGYDEYLTKLTRDLVEARKKAGIDAYKTVYGSNGDDISVSDYPAESTRDYRTYVDELGKCVSHNDKDEEQPDTPGNTQVGGDHYISMGVQPLEACYLNFGYEGLRASIYTKVLKYVGRKKGGLAKHVDDIKKAIHCLEILLEKAKEEQNV